MDAGKGQLAEHEPQPVAELRLQPLDGPKGHAAVGALVVAVLDQGDRGPFSTTPMVAVEIHRRRQILHDRAHHITSSLLVEIQLHGAKGLSDDSADRDGDPGRRGGVEAAQVLGLSP
jgi:hypothetical protein